MSDVTILSSLVEKKEQQENGFTVTSFKLSGEPSAAAIVNAVKANYHRLTGRIKPTVEMLQARIGQKVTLVLGSENMLGSGMVIAREGTLFLGSKGIGIIPKGKRTKGFNVDQNMDRVIDVLDGYVAAEAIAHVEGVRSHYPELVNLTQERLLQLPGESQGDGMCTLAVFGTDPMPDSISSDALWLIGEYWPEDDICDANVLLIRPEHGFSEHGSCYGRQLLNLPVGEVVGFEPISFRDAIALCSLDYDEAVRRVFSNVRPAGDLAAA